MDPDSLNLDTDQDLLNPDTDPDPAFQVNPDPDADPGGMDELSGEKIQLKFFLFFF